MKHLIIFSMLILTIGSMGCAKKAAVSKDDSELDSADTQSSDPNSQSTDSDDDSSSNTYGISYFDTDPASDCPHPHVVENCANGWCEIPAGCYIWGSPEDQPCRGANTENQVQVTLTQSFIIQQTEVTQTQWEAAGFPNPVPNGVNGDADVGQNKPIIYVNWYEAMAFANALSDKEGFERCYDLSDCTGSIGSGCSEGEESCDNDDLEDVFNCPGDPHVHENWYACSGYRLPTNAEWEYAARAGTSTATYNGDFENSLEYGDVYEVPVLEPIAWYRSSENGNSLHDVAQKQPNRWGLYDVLGNAREWIDYVFNGYSLATNEGTDGPLIDPMGIKDDTILRRPLRGGFYTSYACRTSVTNNNEDSSDDRSLLNSFRLVRTLSLKK
ncbi:MAG: formylglycine-generating enzyme family protein [Deltaproteobacteria bacterium]|nr:formylglycine-generating enzyme family protein [Deltaproteobacteria bacterium]MBN2672973.1 formylglycine-generating enzyme family protein [Deltaproteobacteria bacterium]